MSSMSRRSLVSLAAALPVAAVQPAAPASTSGEELTAAREQFRANAAQLSNTPLPMSTEPATCFKA